MKDIYDGSYLTTDPDGGLWRKRPIDDMVCDFCCQKIGDTCWTYPCAEMELPMLDDPTGLQAFSDDSWACCEDCHPMVAAKNWSKLAEKSLNTQLQEAGLTFKGLPFQPHLLDVLNEIVAHLERFDAHRIGEPYQEHAPYQEHK